MRHTLTAVYDDRGKAQHALDALLASGYSSDDAVLVTMPGAAPAAGADEPAAPTWGARPGASAARFLARLFDHAPREQEAAAPGPRPPDSYVLTLEARSEPEAQRAATLVEGFIRVDSDAASTAASGARRASYPPEAAPGALQYYARGSEHYFGTRESDDMSTRGSTFREPMLPAVLWLNPEQGRPGDDAQGARMDSTAAPAGATGAFAGNRWKRRHLGELPAWDDFMATLRQGWRKRGRGMNVDEADFRRHHAATFPGTDYDDFASAYHHGEDMRRRALWRGRSWDEVEAELRTDWQGNHRAGRRLPWEEAKAALRHGWDYLAP